MTLFTELFLIFFFCLLGEIIALFLPFSFPASIISMLLLLLSLLLGWMKPKQIEGISQFLLSNMAFFFIPAGVSIIEKYELLRGNILSLIIVCVLTTILTFYATVYTVIFVMKLQRKKDSL